MTPIGPLKFRRAEEGLRRQVEVAAAAAWEALVEVHTGHALRFVALMAAEMDFDDAVERYLDELDVRDPMASAIRSRVLVALEHAIQEDPERPSLRAYEREPESEADEDGSGGEHDGPAGEGSGLRRFRPDVLMRDVARDVARKVRETEALEEWIRLAVARAEEGVIKAHIDNAIVFTGLLRGQLSMRDAVDDYLELMRVYGGRAQSVHQRTMARLAELHLPGTEIDGGEEDDGD